MPQAATEPRELRPPGWKEGDPTILWTGQGDPTPADLQYLESQLGFKQGIVSGPGSKPSILKRMLKPFEEGTSIGPAIGSTVGSVAGGRVGGAIGGAAGKGYESLITHARELPGAVKDIYQNLKDPAARGATLKGFATGMGEGVLGAGGAAGAQVALGEFGTQTLGRLQARYGPKLSKWLMNVATRNVAQRILDDFPGIKDDMIDKALTISKGGLDRALALVARWKGEADQAIQFAEQQGQTVPIKLTWEMTQLLKNALVTDLQKTGGLTPAPGAVTPLMSRLPKATRTLLIRASRAAAKMQPIDLTPTQADLLKTELQAFVRGKGAYRTGEILKGKSATKIEVEEIKAAASDLNTWLDKIATGYKDANKQAQRAIGASRVIKSQQRSVERHVFRTPVVRGGVIAASGITGAAVGHGTLGIEVGAVIEMLDNPYILSHGAVLLKRPAVQAVVSQVPPKTAALLVSVLRQGRNAPPEDVAAIKQMLATAPTDPAGR